MDKATSKERCMHYIGWHANAYGAPADTESVQAIMKKHQNLDNQSTNDLLETLKNENQIEYWEGKYTEGWVIPDHQN